MSKHFRLIPFQESHAAEIVHWAMSAEEASQWGGSGIACPLDTSLFQKWHADSDVRPFVLCEDDALLGYGEVWADSAEQEVELGRIIIEPAYRGQGVGQRFVALLLEQAALTGYRHAFVRVVPENRVAIACYRRSGFSPVSEEEQQRYNQGQPVEYLWLQRELLPH